MLPGMSGTHVPVGTTLNNVGQVPYILVPYSALHGGTYLVNQAKVNEHSCLCMLSKLSKCFMNSR